MLKDMANKAKTDKKPEERQTPRIQEKKPTIFNQPTKSDITDNKKPKNLQYHHFTHWLGSSLPRYSRN